VNIIMGVHYGTIPLYKWEDATKLKIVPSFQYADGREFFRIFNILEGEPIYLQFDVIAGERNVIKIKILDDPRPLMEIRTRIHKDQLFTQTLDTKGEEAIILCACKNISLTFHQTSGFSHDENVLYTIAVTGEIRKRVFAEHMGFLIQRNPRIGITR